MLFFCSGLLRDVEMPHLSFLSPVSGSLWPSSCIHQANSPLVSGLSALAPHRLLYSLAAYRETQNMKWEAVVDVVLNVSPLRDPAAPKHRERNTTWAWRRGLVMTTAKHTKEVVWSYLFAHSGLYLVLFAVILILFPLQLPPGLGCHVLYLCWPPVFILFGPSFSTDVSPLSSSFLSLRQLDRRTSHLLT